MTLAGIVADLRFTLVQLRRSPAFTLTAVLTLAIGAGANTGIFSLLDGFLRPLPVPRAHEIVIIAADVPGDETGFRYKFSYPALVDYRNQNDVFSDVFAFDIRMAGLTANERTTLFTYQIVTGNFFAGLQLEPAIGRLFAAGEGEAPAGESLVVLGHGYWLARFGGDPNIVGAVVRVDGAPARIIGVAPAGFNGMVAGAEMQGYIPLGTLRREAGPNQFAERTIHSLTVAARLKPGVPIESAQAAVDVIARRLHAQYPASDTATSARVLPEPLARPIPLRFLTDLMPLVRTATLALAALVLLIACMNVANLLLVRASVRQREMAVRAALGSGRWRLVRLMLIESVVLAFAGTAIGLLLARWATMLFLGSINLAVDLPVALDFDYDWRMFAYATAITVLTGVATGILPGLRASRGPVNALLHEGGRGGSDGSGRQRLRRGLVVAQVAGSLVLLVVAGLFVRSLQEAERIDLGFEPRNLLTVRLDPRQIGYTSERSALFFDELERRLHALPGVEQVTTAFSSPMGYLFDACTLFPDDTVREADDPQNSVSCNSVGSGYFETMRIPLVRGRGFTPQDDDGSVRVAVVNETMARRQWPNQDPIGKRLRLERRGDSVWQVVGVVRDSKYIAAFETPLPHIYLPMAQNRSFMRVVFVRSALAPEALGTQMQREVHMLDAEMPIADLKTMNQLLEGGMGVLLFRWSAMQAGAMGLAGLVLAIVGVYGVVSYGASQRAREMAIRLALGADPRAVATLVLRQGSVLVTLGVVVGLLVAVLVTRIIGEFFFVVSPTDLPTFAAVAIALFAIALLACFLPAKRVMRMDPMAVLRRD
jgi:macrolide transport system ATP-binding/permease protein